MTDQTDYQRHNTSFYSWEDLFNSWNKIKYISIFQTNFIQKSHLQIRPGQHGVSRPPWPSSLKHNILPLLQGNHLLPRAAGKQISEPSVCRAQHHVRGPERHQQNTVSQDGNVFTHLICCCNYYNIAIKSVSYTSCSRCF